jgi:hypothetical protein
VCCSQATRACLLEIPELVGCFRGVYLVQFPETRSTDKLQLWNLTAYSPHRLARKLLFHSSMPPTSPNELHVLVNNQARPRLAIPCPPNSPSVIPTSSTSTNTSISTSITTGTIGTSGATSNLGIYHYYYYVRQVSFQLLFMFLLHF